MFDVTCPCPSNGHLHGEHLHSVCHTLWFIIFPMIKISAFTLFNAKSMESVYAKTLSHICSITSLIFNGFSICKKFWKAETQGFPTIVFTLFNVKSMGPVYAKTVSHILLHNFLNIAPFTHFAV